MWALHEGLGDEALHLISTERINRVWNWREEGNRLMISKWCVVVCETVSAPYFFILGPFDTKDEAEIFIVDYEMKNGRLEESGLEVGFHPYIKVFPWIGRKRLRSKELISTKATACE